jgi:hypothetical protein
MDGWMPGGKCAVRVPVPGRAVWVGWGEIKVVWGREKGRGEKQVIIPGTSGLIKICPSRMAVGGQTGVLGDGMLFHHYKVGVRIKKSEAKGRHKFCSFPLCFSFSRCGGVSLRCEDGRRR